MRRLGGPNVECPHCGHVWQARSGMPASCPRCKHYLRPLQGPLSPRNPVDGGLESRVREVEHASHVNMVTALLVIDRLVERGFLTEAEANEICSEATEDADEEIRRLELDGL